jgi:hypothetical protein
MKNKIRIASSAGKVVVEGKANRILEFTPDEARLLAELTQDGISKELTAMADVAEMLFPRPEKKEIPNKEISLDYAPA